MIVLAWIVTVAFASYSAYQIGRRVELGRIERAQAEAEEVAYQRSRRRGTVRLNTVQVRR